MLFEILGWYRPFILKMDSDVYSSDVCDGFVQVPVNHKPWYPSVSFCHKSFCFNHFWKSVGCMKANKINSVQNKVGKWLSFFVFIFYSKDIHCRDLKQDAHTTSSSTYHCSIVVYCTVLYTVLYCTVHCTVHCTVLYCTLYYTVLYCTLYCTVLCI